MHILTETFQHAMMITGFVFVMMLVIECLNVLTSGDWDRIVARWRWRQWLVSSFLGVTPGCLGAYAVVSLYAHRVVTFGALVAAMIATSGDEAFVMLAMFPRRALLLFGILFAVGILGGWIADAIAKGRKTVPTAHLRSYVASHAAEQRCVPLSRAEIVAQWKKCSAHRGWLTVFLTIFLLGVVSGEIGHGDWDWIRVTLLLAGVVGLLIVITVPDHFLEEHLWHHIVKVHIWRVFLWTLGALLLVHVLLAHATTESLIREGRFPMLVIACMVGLIPESGPHLVFVTLYAQGAVPFSVLLAASIVQDGHGMIPLLAHSRRAFVAVKAVNLAIGLLVGLLGHFMGF